MRFHELADDAQILLVVHGAFGDGDLEQFFVIRLWAVQVAVHEARAQELAAEVDDLGRVAYERLDAGIVSYVHDVAAAHGDGLRYVSFVYERLHVAVLEYEVGRLAGCLRFASMLVSAAPSSAGALHPNGPPSSIPAASTDAPATNERRVSALCRPSPWFVLCVMTIPSFPCSTIRLPDPLCRRHLARRYGRRGPATINAKMDACSKEGLFFSTL